MHLLAYPFSKSSTKGNMTLDEFIAGAEAQLLAFKAATLDRSKTDDSFYLKRENNDWWREVAAYHEYVELEEKFQKE